MKNEVWSHQTQLRVRGYELDSYRHVNHAVYANYLEQARWEFLAEQGLSLAKLDQMKRWPVVVRLEIDYKRPAFIDQVLTVRSRVSKVGGASFEISHEIIHDLALVVSARVIAAIIDETGKATRVPDEFRRLQDLPGTSS
ncbi:MAG: hypothetical protein RJB38_1181 [Pseudomonadota bacterium]|jgi:YbgC/YbaW family acyl-CoA thioester hydrolase